MAWCIYRVSKINRVGFWIEAQWLHGFVKSFFFFSDFSGNFRAGTFRNTMFRKSPEHDGIKGNPKITLYYQFSETINNNYYMCPQLHVYTVHVDGQDVNVLQLEILITVTTTAKFTCIHVHAGSLGLQERDY